MSSGETELQRRINGLKATSHVDGERWLASAMHPPTKSNNPGYPDSDCTASIRTNANVNYTVAPPGGLTADQTWSATIVSNPNNAYFPGYVVVYITESFSVVQKAINAYAASANYYAEDSSTLVGNYITRICGQSQCAAFNADCTQISKISDSNCVAYFKPIYDTYMPAAEELTAWRCIGASNTSYLDCAEMYKQGMVYGAHAPKQTSQQVSISGGTLYSTTTSVTGSAYDAQGTLTNLVDVALTKVCNYVDMSLLNTPHTAFPNGLPDTTYTLDSVKKTTTSFAYDIVTAANGPVTINSPWLDYVAGDDVAVAGVSGSDIMLTHNGVVKSILGSTYVAASAAGMITGPVLSYTTATVDIPNSAIRTVLDYSGLHSTGRYMLAEDSAGELFVVEDDDGASNNNMGSVQRSTISQTTAIIPLDRQSLQAASEMMQHEAKHGAYQVSRLYDSENPYKFSANAPTTLVSDPDGTANPGNTGDATMLKSKRGTVCNLYQYSTNSTSPIRPRTVQPVFDATLYEQMQAKSGVSPFVCIKLSNIDEQKVMDFSKLFTQCVYNSMPSTDVWSLPVSMFIGLSPQSTIQGKIARDLEYIPSPDSSMAALASPGALSDEAAIYNGLLLLNAIPVLMYEKDNNMGDFLKAAWSAIKTYGPKLLPTISMVSPAAGVGVKGGIAIGKSIEKLIADVKENKKTADAAKAAADKASKQVATVKKGG